MIAQLRIGQWLFRGSSRPEIHSAFPLGGEARAEIGGASTRSALGWLAPALVGAVGLLLTACAAPATSPPSPTAPTSAPATPAPAATTAAPAGAPAPSASASAAADPSPAVAGGATVLTLVPDASQASYRAHEQLVGRSLPNDAVGTTRAVSGKIVLSPNGSIASEQSSLTVDLRTLKSDESRRDNFIQRNTLQTDQFPTATFVPRAIAGLPQPLPTEGSASFELSGDLTVHGVTRPVTWQVTAQFSTQEVSGSATTNVELTDFGMTPPKAGPVVSVENGLGLQIDFRAARATGAAS